MVKHSGQSWELLELNLKEERTLYLLKNITFEMELLGKLKEQIKKLTDTNANYRIYADILARDLPIGVLITDKHFNVSFANNTLKRFFHIPSKARLQKCYNYVRGIKPCPECILKTVAKDSSKNKKTFATDDGFVTAEIHQLDESLAQPAKGEAKYLITYRETTKEIKLIRQIKTQQENLEKANNLIAEQNDILKRLSNINLRISQLKDLDAILGIVINSIIETFEAHKGAILLFNRAGHIESAHFTGTVTEEEQAHIIDHIGTSAFSAPSIEDGLLKGYNLIDMMDINQQPIGKLFLFEPGKNVDHSILQLFLTQVNNFLENLRLHRKLEEVAHTDSLTGVFNRYYFDKNFKKEMDLSMRFGQPLSVIIVDVNGLKKANDVIGHEAGDALLKETATLLSANISVFDSLYRIGGDEFVLLLSNCPENQLKIMVEMFEEIQTVSSIQFKDKKLPVRFSLGGACSTEVPHYKLKDTADKRMYANKEEYYETHKKYR